jgi:hypothetical protein
MMQPKRYLHNGKYWHRSAQPDYDNILIIYRIACLNKRKPTAKAISKNDENKHDRLEGTGHVKISKRANYFNTNRTG